MSGSTSSYLLYCAAGLILSTLVTLLFEAYPTIRVASDGGVVYWHYVRHFVPCH